MSRLYVRVYLALLAVIVVFFACSALLFWQREGGPESGSLAATSAIAELLLPPADAEPAAQAAAVARIAAALDGGVALFDAEGRRIAEAGGYVPLPHVERRTSHPLPGPPGRRGVALRLRDGRWLAARASVPPHDHWGLFAGLALLATLIGVAAYPVARGLARRLEALTARVDAFGRGDLAVRAGISGKDEVARLAASFDQAAARIEALVGTQRTLLASASHALRSPLARLRVAAELLTDEPAPAPARGRELREQLAREVTSLDAAVEELLAVSRLELGAAEHAPVDLLALAAEEGARAGAEVAGAPAELLGDARSLRHLLRNLLENARRYAPGTIELAVVPLDAARGRRRLHHRRRPRPGHSRRGARAHLRAFREGLRAVVRHRHRRGPRARDRASDRPAPRRRRARPPTRGRRQRLRGRPSRAPGASDMSTSLLNRESEGLPCEQATGWRSQFAHPRGVLGRLAGRLMARKNGAMNAACVEWLDVAPRDRVLEIGFGHGRTVQLLAARAVEGSVAGVDPSDTMLSQAARRNRGAIAAGRVRLERGEAARLPFADASFDKALASNCVQFWRDVPAALAEIRRVLAPGGVLLIGIRVHDPAGGRFASPGFREEQIEAVRRAVAGAGFAELRVLRRNVGREVVGILARL